MKNEDYNEWQTAWQASESCEAEPQMESLLIRMKKHENRNKRLNLVKGSAVVMLLAAISLQLSLHKGPVNLFMIVGLMLVAINTILFMTTLFSKQFQLKKMDLGQPALDFIRQAIKALPAEMHHIDRFLPFFLVLQAIGANIMFLDLWPRTEPLVMILLHLGLTLFLFLAAYLGLSVRRRIFRRNTAPLIEELKQTERAWSRGEE